MANEDEARAHSHFNIMVCGASGIGKSSFIELFVGKFHFDSEVSRTDSLKQSTIVEDMHEHVIKEHTATFQINEKEVESMDGKFKLRVIDSAG